MTDQVDVVLNEIIFEFFQWQRAIGETGDEGVFSMLTPSGLYVFAGEKIVNEVTSGTCVSRVLVISFLSDSRAERQAVRRVEVIDGSTAFAYVSAGLDTSFDVLASCTDRLRY